MVSSDLCYEQRFRLARVEHLANTLAPNIIMGNYQEIKITLQLYSV